MDNESLISQLKGGLIASCQALPGEPLYIEGDTMMPLMAKAAKMLELGAYAVVVGGAITRPLEIAQRFMKEISKIYK